MVASIGKGTRDKGAVGEREVKDALNHIVWALLKERGIEHGYKEYVQRNQNQSAVGGKDLCGTGCFGLAIEVKRCESLYLNQWWKQTVDSAKRLGEFPVLIYRQNKMPFTVVTMAQLWIDEDKKHWTRVSMTFDNFKAWFEVTARHRLDQGWELNV